MFRHQFAFREKMWLPLALAMLLFLPLFAAQAQPPDTLWSRQWDFGETEFTTCVSATRDGGAITTSTTDYDGDWDTWLCRINGQGDVIWDMFWGGNQTDVISYIEQTSDGGFITCGATQLYSPDNSHAAFIRKLNAQGEEEWIRIHNTYPFDDDAICVRETTDGSFVAVGFQQNATIFQWKVSASGDHQWLQSYPSFDVEFVEPTHDGGTVIGGYTFSEGHGYAYLRRSNSSGGTIWTSYEVPDTRAECVRELPDGRLAITGYKANLVDFQNPYVAVYSSDGDLEQEIELPQPGTQWMHSLIVLPSGDFLIGGKHELFPFDSRRWIYKFSQAGELLWDTQVGDSTGIIISMAFSREGALYVTGGDQAILNWGEDLDLFKLEPEVDLSLQGQVTIVPATGGTVLYGGQTGNILTNPATLDLWALLHTPNGWHLPLQHSTVTLQPGATYTASAIPIQIPAIAPPGLYVYELMLGDYGHPMNSMGHGLFTFTKLPE